MFYRVKQFYLAVTAEVLEEEKRFVAAHLTAQEQGLFGRLQVSEQKHCINVAYDVNNHIHSDHKEDLIRLALLHDIGKIEGRLTPIDKGILVILDKVTQGKIRRYTQYKKVNIYYNHGKLGYKLLGKMGGYDQDFLRRIRDHHCEEETDDEILRVLQKWDDEN